MDYILLSIHLLMDTWFASTFWFLWIILFVLLSTYPEMELMDNTAILCLIFWAIAMLFFVVAKPFWIVHKFHFHHSLADTCYFLFFFSTAAILMVLRWCIMVRISFSMCSLFTLSVVSYPSKIVFQNSYWKITDF